MLPSMSCVDIKADVNSLCPYSDLVYKEDVLGAQTGGGMLAHTVCTYQYRYVGFEEERYCRWLV